MRHALLSSIAYLFVSSATMAQSTQPATTRPAPQPFGNYALPNIRLRDVCIFPDAATKTYYMVGPGRRGVRIFTSRDLCNWEGPSPIYSVPDDLWGDVPVVGVWAPEMQKYKDKYYLFLTFDTRTKLQEQWPNWVERVRRGSQVLVGDSPHGPFKPLANKPTLPTDMMTLDGTLWVEDNVPYMVYCHEWVQITNGTIEYVQLKDDLSEAVGQPVKMFHGTEAPWSTIGKQHGNTVTDGPYLYRSKSGKLFMIWTSGSKSGYACGLAVSASGKLAGPWEQKPEPLFDENGGHGMLFTTFTGKLMLVLHAPNGRDARPRVFELEDTGDTLRVKGEFTGQTSEAAGG